MRRFWRFYFLRVILVLVVLELIYFTWLQYRNHKPIAMDDTATVSQMHGIMLDILRNDSDEDMEDTIRIKNIDSPLHGTVKQINHKIMEYIPEISFHGVDSFTYSIMDASKISKPATIKITVLKNEKPMAVNDTLIFYTADMIPLPLTGNDSDNENDHITINFYSSPQFGSIVKKGNQLYYKPDKKIPLTDNFTYTLTDGLSVSEKAAVILSLIDKANPLYPWLNTDIGTPALKGNTIKKGNEIIVTGSGSDIWQNEDHFHYAYQMVEGDFQMTTKVKSLDKTNGWAKGGIMMRTGLSASAVNAYICLSNDFGTNCQFRFKNNDATNSENNRGDIYAPYWLKLERDGNVLIGSRSPNGKEWFEVRRDSIAALPNAVYLGLATTSHNDEALCKVIYDLKHTLLKTK